MNDAVRTLETRILELQKELSAARRAAAPEPVSDYTLLQPDGAPIALSALFGAKPDLLVIHNMGRRCVYCTLWADGLQSFRPHIEDRCGLIITTPDAPAIAATFAASRGWTTRVISHAGSTFAHDLGFEPKPGEHWPGVSALRRRPDGAIIRTGRAQFGPGDPFCAPWHLFDLLQGGAGDWAPRYEYT